MSSIAIANAASTALPTVNFRSHGRAHGGRKMSSEMESQGATSIGTVGQMPVGAAQGLLGNMLQSLQQAVGAQSAAATPATPATPATSTTAATGTGTASTTGTGTSAAATPASPGIAQDLNGFLHSLFQVLRQEGTAGAAAATPSTGSGTGTAAAVGGAGQYQGSLASSLQTLIQQVGSNGSTTPAIANLESSFNTLAQGLSGNASSGASASDAGGTASTQSSTASLQNFLNNLLHNLQANGLQTPNLSGSSVNAKA
jgi:hypothetical protein